MGAVITPESKARIESLIQKGIDEGAVPLVDGRQASISGYEKGIFVRPTVLENLNRESEIVRTEIFGPVLGLVQVDTIDEANQFINSGQYGNMACLFTSSGANARKFRYEAEVGQYRHQYWRGRTDGFLSLQRLERQLFRRFARPRAARF